MSRVGPGRLSSDQANEPAAATPATSFTLLAGTVLFLVPHPSIAGTTNASGDNAEFFWDDANNRLGIRTNTPTTNLDVVGDFRVNHAGPHAIGGATSATAQMNVGATQFTATGTTGATVRIVQASTGASDRNYGLWVDGGETRLDAGLFFVAGAETGVGTRDNFGFTISTNNVIRARFTNGGIFILNDSVSTGATLGDMVFSNTRGPRGINNAASNTIGLIRLNTSDQIVLDPGFGNRVVIGDSTSRLHIPVVATGSLPAAGAAEDGSLLIEDAGVGDRNLILYAGGQRFRIDGGANV